MGSKEVIVYIGFHHCSSEGNTSWHVTMWRAKYVIFYLEEMYEWKLVSAEKIQENKIQARENDLENNQNYETQWRKQNMGGNNECGGKERINKDKGFVVEIWNVLTSVVSVPAYWWHENLKLFTRHYTIISNSTSVLDVYIIAIVLLKGIRHKWLCRKKTNILWKQNRNVKNEQRQNIWNWQFCTNQDSLW